MILQFDLKRQPQVADLISDMQMGDKVCFVASIKSKNDNIAEFTFEKAMDCPDDMMDEESDANESENEAETDGDEMPDHSKMPAPGGSRNTPGGSADQDKMAAALTAQL